MRLYLPNHWDELNAVKTSFTGFCSSLSYKCALVQLSEALLKSNISLYHEEEPSSTCRKEIRYYHTSTSLLIWVTISVLSVLSIRAWTWNWVRRMRKSKWFCRYARHAYLDASANIMLSRNQMKKALQWDFSNMIRICGSNWITVAITKLVEATSRKKQVTMIFLMPSNSTR